MVSEKLGAQMIIDLNFFETIKLGFCKSHATTGIFLDVEKAFDQVWDHGLPFKLTKMDLNRKLIRWISNFLYQRKLIISINDQLSDPINPIHVSPKAATSLLSRLFYMLVTFLNLLIHR